MRAAISTAASARAPVAAALLGARDWRLVAAVLMTLCGSQAAWGTWKFWTQSYAFPLIALCAAAYVFAVEASSRVGRFTRQESLRVGFLAVTLAFGSVIAAIALTRIYYSRSFLATAYLCALVWYAMEQRLAARAHPPRLLVVPGLATDELRGVTGIELTFLTHPAAAGRADGVVVDWHERLAPEWVRFLADCSLKGIATHHAAVVYEAFTGRVSLSHLSAGLVEEVRLPPVWSIAKRLIDLCVVLLAAPLVLPLMLVTAIVIRCGSKGPVLFWQERVGRGGEPFRMVKFRSMRTDAEAQGARFAGCGDDRVTAFGRFIRKFRIDELPQFWNILKGEMSLIGPRPEQTAFARRFETEIPFYSYRHLVRPGITGWAQVNHGYAASLSETRGKLEHDLYYIKHYSFWLDALIVFRTIRTILTGFGAR